MRKLEWIIPIRLVSESNQTGEHWTVKSKRHKTQQMQVRAEMGQIHNRIELPCVIVLTRMSPRLLDDDNLVGAFKHIRDQVADLILPGQAKGQADRDPRLKWEYDQTKAQDRCIKIEILAAADIFLEDS